MPYTILEPETPSKGGYTVLEPEGRSIQKFNRTAAQPLESVPMMTRIGAALGPEMVEPYTPHGMLSQGARLMNLGRRALGMQPWADPNTDVSPLRTILEGNPESMRSDALLRKMKGLPPEMIGPPAPVHPSVLGGIAQSVRRGLENVTTPETLLQAPALLNPLGRALMLGQTVGQGIENVKTLPERASEAGAQPGATLGDLSKLLTGEIGNEAILPVLLARGVPQVEPRLSGITPQEPIYFGPESQIAERSEPKAVAPALPPRPEGTTYVAGPQGARQVGELPLSVAGQYEMAQPRQPAGLLSAPPFQAGPTTLEQTLRNIESIGREGEARAPEPTSREGVAPTKLFSGAPVDPEDVKRLGFDPETGLTKAEQETKDELYDKYTQLLNKEFPGQGIITKDQVSLRLALAANPKLIELSKDSAFAYAMVKNWLEEGKLMHQALQKFGVDPKELDALFSIERKGTTHLSKSEKMYSGAPVDRDLINRLVPAVRIGNEVVLGKQGETHADIIQRRGGNANDIPHPDPRRMFVDPKTGKEYTRSEASAATGIAGTASAGGLDSMDLPGARAQRTFTPAMYYPDDQTVSLGRHQESRNAFPDKKGFPGYMDEEGNFYTLTEVAREKEKGHLLGNPYGIQETGEVPRPSLTRYKGRPVYISSLGRVETGPKLPGAKGQRDLPLGNLEGMPKFAEMRKGLDDPSVVAKADAAQIKEGESLRYSGTPISEADRAKLILSNPNAKPFERKGQVAPQPGGRLRVGERLGNFRSHVSNIANEADKIVNPWDVIFDWMDGGEAKFKGPLMEHIRKPLDDRYNASANEYHGYADPIRDLARKHKMGDVQSGRIGVFLQAQQEGGIARMVESGIDQKVINNILRSLTDEERAVAGEMRRVVDTLGPKVAEVARRADEIDVKLVRNYFPWARDWRRFKPEADELATNPAARTGNVSDVLWPGLPEARQRNIPGSLEERTPRAKTPISVDAFSTFDRYLRDATHYVATREFLKDTEKIIRSDQFARRYGDMGQDLMMEFLNTFARQGRYKSNRIIDALRKGTSRGVVGLRIPSQLVHMANIPLAMKHVGPLWWSKALDDVWTDEGQEFLHRHFAETFERGGGEPALRELEQTKTGQSSLMAKATTAAFAGQRFIDRTVTQAAVLGSYMKEIARKGKDPTAYAELPVDVDAVRQARVQARRAVASPIYKDVPPVLTRGGSLSKAFFQFQNTFLDQYSNLRYELAQVGVPAALRGDPKELAGMLFALAAMLATETSIKHAYKVAKGKLADTQKEDKDAYQKELLFEASRRIPGAGQLQSAILYGETGVPAIDVALNIPKEVYKAVKSEETSGKVLHATRAVGSALELGVPGASEATDVATALEQRQFFKPHEKRLQGETGKSVESMSLKERVSAERQHKDTSEKLSPEAKAKAAGRAVENIAKRGSEIAATLSKPDRQWLESRQLPVPGFDNKLSIAGQKVYLTKSETERLAKYTTEEYTKFALPLLRKRYDAVSERARDELFSEVMSAARERARARIEKELNSKNESNKPKRKRYSAFDYLK